jgi:hypothetical protein
MGSKESDQTTVGMPACGHNNSFIIETRWRKDGLVRRRHECCVCQARWTVFGPERRPEREKRKPGKPHLLLTLEQVYRILTERHRGDTELAAELGVTRQAVNQVRIGKSWRSAFPELPRKRQWVSCLDCKHWEHGECGLGFPDPEEEGPEFAADCDLYEV